MKRFWVFGLFLFIATLFVLNKIVPFREVPLPVSPTPLTNKVATYKSLIPGKSSQDEINALLGFPLNISEGEEGIVAEYKSTNEYRNHLVTVENGTARLIKEVINTVDNKKSDFITNEYGTAPYILYDQYPGTTFHLYTYPENGIAYLGHKDGTILEIWYFETTTIDDFLNLWGEGYGNEESKEVPGY